MATAVMPASTMPTITSASVISIERRLRRRFWNRRLRRLCETWASTPSKPRSWSCRRGGVT
jgi:hypothetical protein